MSLQRFLEEIFWLFEAMPALKKPCQKKIMPSRAAGCYRRDERMSRRRWRLKVVGCQR